MDLHKLRVFRAAALAEGFTKASEELHISQSTVSLHIKELEDELNCQLFLRVGRKVLLNEAGRVLLECSEKVFRELKNTEMTVRELNSMHRGTIRLGTGATTLMYRLRPAIAAFRKRFPQLELIIESGTTELLIQQTMAQRLDLAVLMCPISHPSLRVTELGREELVVAVPPDYPVGRHRQISVRELAAMNFILYRPNTSMQRVISRWFDEMGIEPKVSVEMENIEAIKSLVSAGLACSILPACSLAEARKNSEIRVVRVKDKPLFRTLGLACLNAEILPTSMLELSRLIQKEIQSQLSRECAQA